MALFKGRLGESAKLAAYVTVVILALNYLLKMISIQLPAQLFGINVPLATGITPTVGSKILGFINGIIAFDITSLIILFVSALAIVFVGTMIRDYSPLPKGKTDWSRIALVLLYGTAVFYLVLVGFKMLTLNSLLGIALWYAIVAFSVGLVQKWIRI